MITFTRLTTPCTDSLSITFTASKNPSALSMNVPSVLLSFSIDSLAPSAIPDISPLTAEPTKLPIDLNNASIRPPNESVNSDTREVNVSIILITRSITELTISSALSVINLIRDTNRSISFPTIVGPSSRSLSKTVLRSSIAVSTIVGIVSLRAAHAAVISVTNVCDNAPALSSITPRNSTMPRASCLKNRGTNPRIDANITCNDAAAAAPDPANVARPTERASTPAPIAATATPNNNNAPLSASNTPVSGANAIPAKPNITNVPAMAISATRT